MGVQLRVCDSYKGKAPEDDHGAVDHTVDPRGNGNVGNLGEVVSRPLEVRNDDDPSGHHGKPPKDVRNHAADKVLPALGLHEIVRLGTHDCIGGLDVVERPVERPLVLRDQGKRLRVVAVPFNGVGRRQPRAPDCKLVGAHGPVVRGGVDERFWGCNVLGEEAEDLPVCNRVNGMCAWCAVCGVSGRIKFKA